MSCSTAGKLATIKVLRRNLSFLSAPAPASGVIAKVLNSTEGAHVEIMSTFAPTSIFGTGVASLHVTVVQQCDW